MNSPAISSFISLSSALVLQMGVHDCVLILYLIIALLYRSEILRSFPAILADAHHLGIVGWLLHLLYVFMVMV